MPKELTPYYIDKFDLTSESGCEQKLSLFGLINMDEFDKYRAGQMPDLKNLMQMTTLTFRRAHRPAFSHLPRIASFIGTSNMTDLLLIPQEAAVSFVRKWTARLTAHRPIMRSCSPS